MRTRLHSMFNVYVSLMDAANLRIENENGTSYLSLLLNLVSKHL